MLFLGRLSNRESELVDHNNKQLGVDSLALLLPALSIAVDGKSWLYVAH